MGIKAIHKQLNKIKLDKEVAKIIKSRNQEFTDIIREQMRAGEYKNGKLPDYHSKEYANFKTQMPSYIAPSPTRDLYLTGSFQNKMFAKIEGVSYRFFSRDKKADSILKREPHGIFQFNDENENKAQNYIEPFLIERIKTIFE